MFVVSSNWKLKTTGKEYWSIELLGFQASLFSSGLFIYLLFRFLRIGQAFDVNKFQFNL